jgi:predicted transcriptional regulator
MTSVTIDLPDDLVKKAEQIGILKTAILADYISHFLEEKIRQQSKVTDISAFCGLVTAKSNGKKRSLNDFDAANFVESSHESG